MNMTPHNYNLSTSNIELGEIKLEAILIYLRFCFKKTKKNPLSYLEYLSALRPLTAGARERLRQRSAFYSDLHTYIRSQMKSMKTKH